MRIRPLTLAAAGIFLVAIDLRLVAGDAAPDAIGWALVAFAAHRLGMRWSTFLAAAAALASLAELHLPYECEAYDLLSGRGDRRTRTPTPPMTSGSSSCPSRVPASP